MEYITKKLPRDAEALLHRFQAECVLETGEKITEANAMKKALEYALDHQAEVKRKKGRYSFWKLRGYVKGGPKTNAAKEIDRVVYGI